MDRASPRAVNKKENRTESTIRVLFFLIKVPSKRFMIKKNTAVITMITIRPTVVNETENTSMKFCFQDLD